MTAHTNYIIPLRPIDRLSNRERHVLLHLMEGLTAEQICQADYVCISTVRTQIRNILWKLNVRSQVQAVALAHREVWPNDDERRQAFHQALAPSEMAS